MPEVTSLSALLVTSASIAAGHTLVGIDHTLPFVAMARARRWSLRRTLAVTALCGLGHVGSSLLLAGLGLGLGIALGRLDWIQAARGELAAWALIAFGSFFVARWLVRSARARGHVHAHAHEDGVVHAHAHQHGDAEHMHVHAVRGGGAITVWSLFVIFVLGPCEPLIPLVMAPAALGAWWTLASVVATFCGVTILMMLGVVAAGHVGVRRLELPALAGRADLFAGLAIAGCGLAIQWLGV